MTPAGLAGRPLYEPIAPLLARFSAGLPSLAELDVLLCEQAPGAVTGSGRPIQELQHLGGGVLVAPGAVTGSGRPIRFVPPPAALPAYEQHIDATGEVPTRADDWHDFFNALAWCVWPRSKAACNALHLTEQRSRLAAGLAGRGPRRDALTQFDECGILVVSSDPEISALLAAHAWEAAFWQRRARLLATTRFLVFGHASWDQLREPFFGLCAKAIHRVVDAAWLELPLPARQAEADAWLAAHLASPARPFGKASMVPLPLLGIPGLTPASECADYYRDTRQFRPRRPPVL